MKVRKLVLVFALVAAAAIVLAACSGEDSETLAPFTIEQSDGQTLSVERVPQRIVSMSAHATEIFCAIGAGEQLVAVEQFANCPLGGRERPVVDAFQPNLEAIAGYEPDLVYVFSNTDNIVEALRRIDTPVLYRALPTSLEGVLDEIELFGRLTGREAEAQELILSMRQRMDIVKERIADVDQGPRIFHELDAMYFTVSPDSFIGDFYNLLKAENIAEGATGEYPQLSAEVIIERDPEVIVLADEAAGVTAESVKERPGWNQISAVTNGRVCVVDPDIVSRPGPRIADALEALAECLYPERFP
jgi:iron complex transport system substrate-binding protein